jgi:transcriptional regulator with XRE-family HTH domain
MFTNPAERIKFFRGLKGLTQENMTEMLDMSVTGYGNIERGDTNVSLQKLKEVAKVLGVELQELFASSGKVLISFGETNNNSNEYQIINSQDNSELERVIEQQNKENALLQKRIEDLEEIIRLLKDKQQL